MRIDNTQVTLIVHRNRWAVIVYAVVNYNNKPVTNLPNNTGGADLINIPMTISRSLIVHNGIYNVTRRYKKDNYDMAVVEVSGTEFSVVSVDLASKIMNPLGL